MLRFIFDRALDRLRADVATLLAMLAAAMRWPWVLVGDWVGT